MNHRKVDLIVHVMAVCTILFVALGIVLVIGVGVMVYERSECEAELPRDKYCVQVWIPEEDSNEA